MNEKILEYVFVFEEALIYDENYTEWEKGSIIA